VLSPAVENLFLISSLQPEHQNGAGNSSREYRPRETAFEPLGAGAGAQPFPHNPRKQREILAAAGLGDTFLKGKWRASRDESGHSEHFEIVANFENVDGRTEAKSEARSFAEELLRPYAAGQSRQDEECPHLEIVSAVQHKFQLPRRRAYRRVD